VLTAIYGLLDFPALIRMWRVSRLDFYAAATALGAVLLLGILQGILLAALAFRVAVAGARVAAACCVSWPYSPTPIIIQDLDRHPENEPLPGVIAFRPEASLIYINAESVLESVLVRLRADPGSPPGRLRSIGLAVSRSSPARARCTLLHSELVSRGIKLRIVGAHGSVRDLLRADGIEDKVVALDRTVTLRQLASWQGRITASASNFGRTNQEVLARFSYVKRRSGTPPRVATVGSICKVVRIGSGVCGRWCCCVICVWPGGLALMRPPLSHSRPCWLVAPHGRPRGPGADRGDARRQAAADLCGDHTDARDAVRQRVHGGTARRRSILPASKVAIRRATRPEISSGRRERRIHA
jgi:hypothetical protein